MLSFQTQEVELLGLGLLIRLLAPLTEEKFMKTCLFGLGNCVVSQDLLHERLRSEACSETKISGKAVFPQHGQEDPLPSFVPSNKQLGCLLLHNRIGRKRLAAELAFVGCLL